MRRQKHTRERVGDSDSSRETNASRRRGTRRVVHPSARLERIRLEYEYEYVRLKRL